MMRRKQANEVGCCPHPESSHFEEGGWTGPHIYGCDQCGCRRAPLTDDDVREMRRERYDG